MEWINEHGTVLGIAGLLFFFIFFVGVIVWVFRPGATEKYRTFAKIPLKEDE